MRIGIVFDTVCPWCFVGKRRFDRALKMRPNLRPEIQYRSFLLNPDLPPQGMDRREYLERKFGGVHQYDRIAEALVITGRNEGIDFDLGAIDRMPNSANSHRLVRLAGEYGKADDVVEKLFGAYFEQTLDIGDIEVLADIARDAGMDREETCQYLESDADLNAIYTENARMHRLGITGVPCYIFNEGSAIAGAQEPDILTRLLDMAASQEAERPAMQSIG